MGILTSLAILASFYFFCDSARGYIRKSLSPNLWLRSGLLDFFVSLETVVGAYECGIILEHYGVSIWTIILYFNALYQITRFQEGIASPIAFIEFRIDGKFKSNIETLIRIGFIVLSGLFAVWVVIPTIWSLNLSQFHSNRYKQIYQCNVPPSWTFESSIMAEFVGSLFLCLSIKLTMDNETLAKSDPIYRSSIVSGLVVIAVLCALNISGGMFQPMLASTLLGNCQGHSYGQHFLIYWLSPIIATLIGNQIYQHLILKNQSSKIKSKGKNRKIE